MKTNIISEELNGLEFQVLRDFMKNLIEESIQSIDIHDKESLSWYKDCSMDDYFNEFQEIWNENTLVGKGVDAISHQFILNDETRSDFENAFEQARDEAYQYVIEKLEDEDDENQSIRKMYEDFNNMQHNSFYELYSEEDWDYCNTHTLEQAIIERR